MSTFCWPDSILDFVNTTEKKIGYGSALIEATLYWGQEAGKGLNKQINKYKICQVGGKYYDGKVKKNRECEGGEIMRYIYIYNILYVYTCVCVYV